MEVIWKLKTKKWVMNNTSQILMTINLSNNNRIKNNRINSYHRIRPIKRSNRLQKSQSTLSSNSISSTRKDNLNKNKMDKEEAVYQSMEWELTKHQATPLLKLYRKRNDLMIKLLYI